MMQLQRYSGRQISILKKYAEYRSGVFLTGTEQFDADTQAKIDSINKGIREIKDELAQAKLENDLDKIDNTERDCKLPKKDALAPRVSSRNSKL